MRHNFTKYGFIRPQEISTLDFKISFAHNKQEEHEINRTEPHIECIGINRNENYKKEKEKTSE